MDSNISLNEVETDEDPLFDNHVTANEVNNNILIKKLSNALQKSIETSNSLREDIDALQARLLKNEVENSVQFNKLIDDHQNIAKKVDKIDRDLMDTQQYIRRWTIEITGIPENIQQRDLKNYVIHQVLERTCGYRISPRDVEACHRLFKRNQNEPAHVVARLVNREDAENAIRGRYKLRSFPHLKKIFIIDNLCPRYREIFDDLEELKRSGVVKQLWSYNGKIHYKTNH